MRAFGGLSRGMGVPPISKSGMGVLPIHMAADAPDPRPTSPADTGSPGSSPLAVVHGAVPPIDGGRIAV